MEPLARMRREYAENVRTLAGVRSELLVRAFAAVAREDFVGPGPWQILRPPDITRYETTPDADPRHLYENVLVALDASRNLNNGEPAALARFLDALDLATGEHFLHIGCGVGYYTAIAAECVGERGAVVGVEIDDDLAARAAYHLARWPGARVVAGGDAPGAGEFPAIFVNAGATDVLAGWLDALALDGRLLVPLTVDLPTAQLGAGHLLRVVRRRDGFAARFVAPVGIFHCAGARTREGSERLRDAYSHGDVREVASLRRDAHRADEQCWLHRPQFCLSRLAVEGEP